MAIPSTRTALILSLLVLSTTLFGCSRSQDVAAMTPAPPLASSAESYGAFAISPEAKDPARLARRLSRFFLVEQSSAVVSSSLSSAFRKDPPGGVVFWNFSRGGWRELAATTSHYSKILKSAGHLPAFFSIDYEGGGLPMSPSGKQIAGIQRFRAGFTDLAHGAWLGRSMAQFDTELCALHGQIMSRELAAVGINYPLALVSDLAQRLFSVRGVATNPGLVSRCLSAYTQAVAEAGPVVAVTKHYPGLGQNGGDTHDVESLSLAQNTAESDRHLAPFRDLISYSNANALETRLSVMASHGKFPLIDPDNLTTESSVLLEGILRDRFQFQGVRVSDAMWMGGYGQLQGDALYAAYANAFVSGLDLIMIPGSRYGGALRAFNQIADGTANPELQRALELRSNVTFSTFRARFLNRATESLERLDRTLSSLPYAHETVLQLAPRSLTDRERARYYEILKSLDERWLTQLPESIR